MYFVPLFTEATGIMTLKGVIFSMTFCVGLYIKNIIVSSSNNIFYIQIHHFTQQTQCWINGYNYHTIHYFEPNTKSKGVITTTPYVADVTINSLVAWRLTHLPPTLRKRNARFENCEKIQDSKIKHKFICALLTGCLLSLLVANKILFAYVC